MSTFKHFDEASNQWVIDAAGNASNIELNNEILQDEEGKSISVHRGFQKINNRISKLEHNLAWIYQNGAKGGSGGGSGGGTSYTISTEGDKTIYYTSENNVTVKLIISTAGQKKTMTVVARDASTNKELVRASRSSMTSFNLEIPNLPRNNTQIYLQAYDSADNYTNQLSITVIMGSVSIVQVGTPNLSYTLGGTSSARSTFRILNKTGSPAYLLAYKNTSSATPLQDAISNNETLSSKFGAETCISVTANASPTTYSLDYENYLKAMKPGETLRFKIVLYSPTIDYASKYIEDRVTVTSGDSLVLLLKDIGTSKDEAANYQVAANSTGNLDIMLYYELNDIQRFYYGYTIYYGEENVYTSETLSDVKSTEKYTTLSFSTDNFVPGDNYRIEIVASKNSDLSIVDGLYYKVVGYFSVKEGTYGELKDYPYSPLVARFGMSNFPNTGISDWTYTIPDPTEDSEYGTTAWPVESGNEESRKTTLSIKNHTTTTGIVNKGAKKYLDLSGSTYATIDRFTKLLPNKSQVDGSLFKSGFYLQITYQYLSSNPVNQCILSLGEYKDGSLYRGFEINSDYITAKFGSTEGFSIETPTVAENAYPESAGKKTETVTVGLNVWSTTTQTKTGPEDTYYFALYIDGTLTKCAIIPQNLITNITTSWLLGKPLYLGCRSDLTNQANCYIYDLKLYANNQSDLSIVWNYISAVEQAHLVTVDGTNIVDEDLDTNLRHKNLFQTNSNSCLLCESPQIGGNYLDAKLIYANLIANYSEAGLDYPIIYFEDVSGEDTMYKYMKATWGESDTIGGVPITKKTWPVKATITTKYGKTYIEGDSDAFMPTIAIQGTSSLSYNSKNLEFNVGKVNEDTDKLLKINNWLPENEFTLKADVVDSAHANNVVIGDIINNQTYFPNSPAYDASDLKKKIKKTSEGFPCLVFIKYSNNSVADGLEDDSESKIGKTEFLGVYNFNLGRYAYYNLGLRFLKSYTEEALDENAPQIITEYAVEESKKPIYSMEVSGNFSDTELLFTQADTSIAERMFDCRYYSTDEAAAYSAITNNLLKTLAQASRDHNKYNQKRYNSETNKYEDIVDSQTGKVLEWTSASVLSSEDTVGQNLDLNATRKYFVIAMVFGLVDSVCKNMVFRSWGGTLWYPAFYDMDTAFKMDNGGADSVAYDAFPHKFYNETAAYTKASGVQKFLRTDEGVWKYYYAGMSSADGWPNRIWEVLDQYESDNEKQDGETIGKLYWELRNSVIPDPDEFIDNYFAKYIKNTGSILFNYDYREKYVSYGQTWDPNLGLVADTNNKQTTFLYGTRISAVRSWFKKRINFLDAVYAESNSSTSSTSATSYLSNAWDARQKTNDSSIVSIKIAANQRCKIKYRPESDGTDSEYTYLWVDETPTDYLIRTQSQGNLFRLCGSEILTELPNFYKLSFTSFPSTLNFKLLQELDLSNLTLENWSGSDNLADTTKQTGLLNLQILRMSGTKVNTNITLGLGGCNQLKELYLNNGCSVGSLTLPNSGTLEVLDLTNNTNVQSLTSVIGQSGLRELLLEGTGLTKLSSEGAISQLPSLEKLTLPTTVTELQIDNCGLKTFSNPWYNSSKPSELKSVIITDCDNLESIDLSGQGSLQYFYIARCPKLKTLKLAKVNCGGTVSIELDNMPLLETLDISNTTLFETLNLTKCPNLNNILATNCTSLTKVQCSYDEFNPIELPASAFKGCSALYELQGNFLLQGASVFEDCKKLQFDEYLNKGELNINFDTNSDFSKTFKNCSNLGKSTSDTVWPREFIHRLSDKVGNISEMFYGTDSSFAVSSKLFCRGTSQTLNVTDISGVFQHTNLNGTFTSNLFDYMPNLISASEAFADSSANRRITNNFFEKCVNLTNVDYMFRNNSNLTAVNNTNTTEEPLHSKDFFINLIKCTHPESRSSGSSSITPNPDWPYPYGVFSGTNIKMTVDVNDEGKPFLFHLKKSTYADKIIYLENRLYDGIHLILDSSKCNYSYLFGGTEKTVKDGDTTYYIPKFAKISAPFMDSEDLKLDLSTIDGSIFFEKNLAYLETPFKGMHLTDTSTIPDDIFKGASSIKTMIGIFSDLNLKNTSVFDFSEHPIFKDCTSLENISSIFADCCEFKMKLCSDMFVNCKLTNVVSAFSNSRVVGQLPEKLFHMTNGATIVNMQSVFDKCYNLGYDENYAYQVVPLDLNGKYTGWSDHVVVDSIAKLENYSIPRDLFWWCAADCNIANVLGQMFWTENVVEDSGTVKKVVTNESVFIGPNCKIPEDLFSGSEEFKKSTSLKSVFAKTHFSPYSDTKDYITYKRGNLYPEKLFYGMTNLTDVTGIFAYTEIDKACMINKDLFISDENGTPCPITNMSSAWAYCTFTYKMQDTTDDPGSAQLDYTMFDKYTNLVDVSRMFVNESGKNYGLKLIDSTMFEGIQNKGSGRVLNISMLFANNDFVEECNAPTFDECTLQSDARSYLTGVDPYKIKNRDVIINKARYPASDSRWLAYIESKNN